MNVIEAINIFHIQYIHEIMEHLINELISGIQTESIIIFKICRIEFELDPACSRKITETIFRKNAGTC